MGARDRNFYNQLAIRYGYADAAKEIQDLYLDGNKAEAAAKVPREFLELSNLVGPEGYIKDRLAAYKESGVTVLNAIPIDPDPTSLIEKLKAWSE
jgi:Luciferase-like monooxygenase